MSDDTRQYIAANGLGRVDKVDDGRMTADRESHLAHIIERISTGVDTKYRKGQAEHGGNLWDLSAIQLIDAAIDEVIDQATYLLTIREKLIGR